MSTGQQGGANNEADIDTSVFQEHARAHRGAMRSYIHTIETNETNILQVFENLTTAVHRLLSSILRRMGNFKLVIKVELTMAKHVFDKDGIEQEIIQTVFFTNTIPKQVLDESGIRPAILSIAEDIDGKIVKYTNLGSGYRVKDINSMEVKVYEFAPFHNARGNGYLKLPFRSKGVLNFRTDRNCFKYAVVACIHYDQVKNTLTRMQTYSLKTWQNFFSLYDFSDVQDNVSLGDDLDKFEEKNRISVVVFTNNGQELIFARKPKKSFEKQVNLFMIRKPEIQTEAHYAAIVDINKFMRRGKGNHRFYCPYCGKAFVKEQVQLRHMAKCQPQSDDDPEDETEHIYPAPGSYLSFKRYELTLPAPYILLFDFETYGGEADRDRAPQGASTKVLYEYKPASFSLCIIEYRHEGLPRVVAVDYYDESGDVMDVFFKKLFHWSRALTNFVRRSNNKACPTSEELENHRRATSCEFCEKPFQDLSKVDKEDKEAVKEARRRQKTWHHGHLEGRYLKTICCECNLRIKYKSELTCIAHNFTGKSLNQLMSILHCFLQMHNPSF